MSLPPFVLQASTSSSLPSFPSEIKKLSELTDGVGLCALVSLYCPNELPWTEVALGEPPSMADSLYNIQVCMCTQCSALQTESWLGCRTGNGEKQTKQQPSRDRSGRQLSCCLVSLHFPCYILPSLPVSCNCSHLGIYPIPITQHKVIGYVVKTALVFRIGVL